MTTLLSNPIENPATLPATALEHILVATDFSDNSKLALDWAIELAKAHNARVTLVHAVDPRHIDQTRDQVAHREHVRRNLEHAVKIVRGWQLNAVVEHELGKPWEVIANAAAELKPDLVVIGTSGRTTLAHKLLGGTADRIIRLCPVPVLVIHPGDEQIGRGFRCVLAPIDFSEKSIVAAQMSLRLMKPTVKAPGRLVLLHVVELETHVASFETSWAFDPQYWDNVALGASRRLEALAKTLRRENLSVEVVAVRGFAGTAIIDEAATRGADLIAMGTAGRTGVNRLLIGSVAERVLQDAECSVLAVRGPEPH